MPKWIDNIQNGRDGFRLPEKNDFIQGKDIQEKTGEKKISAHDYFRANFDKTKSPAQRLRELNPPRRWKKPTKELTDYIQGQERLWRERFIEKKTSEVTVAKEKKIRPPLKPLNFTQLMETQYGKEFTEHYQIALVSAQHLEGKHFLEHFGKLKKLATQNKMNPNEWKNFERILYRKFYDAAQQDTLIRYHRSGSEASLKVKPHELSYIARVAQVSEYQLKQDHLALEHGKTRGDIQQIVASNPRLYSTKLA